ncbi:hypothetical protein [Streptosporangium minutum]|uniref:FtsK domain-containing protein n=1 Tax=Streptosporangium minutum TaxID=569862 RepID=A0A243RY26_9ACTN|nr:hypothetical protein [Streptosporangium minutum]OUD00091.1 hypothetical protein CA984_00165 [Streptosporangium minutum]
MGRKKTPAHSGGTAEGGVIHDKVLQRAIAGGVAKALPHTVPWIAGAGMLPVSALTHGLWGGAQALPWATAGLALSGAALTAVTWAISRYRHPLGRMQSTGTTVVASGWLLAATITSPTARPTLDIGLWLGGTLAAAWNVRNIVRPNEANEDQGSALTGAGLFKRMFTANAEKVGVEVGVRNVKAGAHRITATAELSDGDTAEDLQKATGAIEATAGLPMGSIVVTPNRRNAGEPTVTLSNPMLLEEPILWFGPSRPGESVAEPLRVALFQDGEMAEVILPGAHLQVMGMTGAAKTTAGAWGFWGELITREDSALIVVDITKGEQSIGPARPALHRVVNTKAATKKFFAELQATLSERLDHLAAKDLIAWQEGCGLSYLVVWIEEAADVFDFIDMDEFTNLARMLRSAGGSLVWSLQRADSTQMPTIVKGQGGSKLCFGVANAHDAHWGLSEEQEDAGARPEQWKATQPGMAYGEMPGIAAERIAMPMRFLDWGTSNEARVRNFRAHCAAWPATARPVDPITAKICPTPGAAYVAADQAAAVNETDDNDPEVTNVTAEYLTPDPELDDSQPVDLDAPLDEVEDAPLGSGEKMNSATANAVLDKALSEFADGREFQPRDLRHVLDTTGLGRGWIQKQLKVRIAAGSLEHDPETNTYRVRALAHA